MYLAGNEVLTFCFYITLSVQLFPTEGSTKAKIASSCIKIVIAGLALNVLASAATLIQTIYLKIQKYLRRNRNLHKIHGFDTAVDQMPPHTNKEIISSEI